MAFGILFRDKNLLAENIKKGVKILKVTGTCEGGRPINNRDITADSSVALQTFTAGEGYDGIGVFTLRPYSKEDITVDSSTVAQVITPETADCIWTVLVNPYVLDSKTVDSSTVSQTVTSSQDGLGSVTVNPYTLDSKTVDSSTVQQVVNSSADGLSSVTVNPYVLDSKTVDSSTVSQTVNSSADGLSSVTVNPYVLDTMTVDSSTVQQVITSSEDGLSSVTVNPYTLDSKTVDSSTVSQTVTSSEDGLSSVTVNPYVLDSKTVDSSTVQQVITSDEDGLSSVTVNPYVLDTKTVDASINQITVNSSADGLSSVTVNAVTSSIDSNITAGNIKNGTTILGVTGTYGTDGNWIATIRANRNNRPDLTGREILPTRDYGCAYLFFIYTGIAGGYDVSSGYPLFPKITLGNKSYAYMWAFKNCIVKKQDNSEYDLNIYGTSCGSYELQNAFEGFKVQYGNSNVDGNIIFTELTTVNNYGLNNCMKNARFKTVSFPAFTTVTNNYSFYEAFRDNTVLTTVSFPALTNITSGYRAFSYMFRGCSSLRTVNMPELTSVASNNTSGNSTVAYWFSYVNYLNSLSFPKLTTWTADRYSTFTSSLVSMSTPMLATYSCSNSTNELTTLTTITTHPGCMSGNSNTTNFYWSSSNVTSLTLTQNVTDDLHLDNMGSLDRASIVGVLQHLDTNTSGKTCTFYTGGLTVIDDSQHSVQGIYDAAVTAGWTINNLVIYNPDLMITYPRTGNINPFETGNYIEFTSADSWTASVDDNDITLSSYSGSAGTGITIDVTAVSGWSGNATVTITSNGNTKTVPIGLYTRLQYIDAGTTMSNYIDMGFDMDQGDYIQAYFKYNGTPTGGHFISNGGVYSDTGWQFRTFANGSSIYLDAGGGESGNSRYNNSNPFSLVNQKFGWVEFGINSSGYPYFKNPATDDTWTGGTAFTRFTGTDGHTMRYMGDNTSLNEVRVFHNGVMTHDFVAAEVNGAVGLYDTVTDTFKGVTAGTVTAGPEGETYTRHEYAEFTQGTRSPGVQLGCLVQPGDDVVFRYLCNTQNGGTMVGSYPQRPAYDNYVWRTICYVQSNSDYNGLIWDCGGEQYPVGRLCSNIGPSPTEVRNILFELSGNKFQITDLDTMVTEVAQAGTFLGNTRKLCIGGNDGYDQQGFRFYEFTLYDGAYNNGNGDVKAHYIVVKDMNNTNAIYDTVTGFFYYGYYTAIPTVGPVVS